jgi:hypothetical protein
MFRLKIQICKGDLALRFDGHCVDIPEMVRKAPPHPKAGATLRRESAPCPAKDVSHLR